MVLRELRFESAAYRWLELGAPFRIGFDQPELRGVHLVVEGECELVLADGSVEPLATGDLVVLPCGGAHEIRSFAAQARLESGFALAMRTPGTRLRAGGAGARAVVVCGAFVVREQHHPALRGLPHVIRVPGTEGRPAAWLAPYVDALGTEAFEGGRGSELIMARLSDALLARALRYHSDNVGQPGWLAGLRDPYVAAALRAMHENPDRPWTLAGLAATVGLSRAAFAARFTDGSVNRRCATCSRCGCSGLGHCCGSTRAPWPRWPHGSATPPKSPSPPPSNGRWAPHPAPTAAPPPAE